MDRIILYHGSDHVIEKPLFGVGDVHSDYGQAFYCTKELDMAKEWANKTTYSGYANKYRFDGRGLKILDLTDGTFSVLNWIAILFHHRQLSASQRETYKRRLTFLEKHYYIDVQDYDVVIGFRADDAYFKFPLFFIQNELSVSRLEEIYQLGQLGRQVALISKKAFSRISFMEAIEAEPAFRERYITRKNSADSRFEEIRIEEINSDKPKIEDMMRTYDQRQ